MPSTQPGMVNAKTNDWQELLRQLNYIVKDIYAQIDSIKGVDGRIFTGGECNVSDLTITGLTASKVVATDADKKLTSVDGMIRGATSADAHLRYGTLYLDDAVDATKLKASFTSLYNGDTVTLTDNIAKGATTGYYTLNAAGTELTIEAAGLSGNTLMAMGVLAPNDSGADLVAKIYHENNDIVVIMYDELADTKQDMTVLVDTGAMYVQILYLTDA